MRSTEITIPDGLPGFCREILKEFALAAGEAFGDALTGVYLHGSAVMGCFSPEKSDLDLLVVTEGTPSVPAKRRFMEKVVSLNEKAPAKGIEMSVVKREFCENFVFPTPFELHFSPMHLARWEKDPAEYAAHFKGVDPDLAAHFTVLKARGAALCGEEPAKVFGEVPREAYWESIRSDVENAEEELPENPVYLTLNLCRVLAFRREGLVLSKAEGGEWAGKNLPASLHSFVKRAAEDYRGGAPFAPGREESASFARFMLEEIEKGKEA